MPSLFGDRNRCPFKSNACKVGCRMFGGITGRASSISLRSDQQEHTRHSCSDSLVGRRGSCQIASSYLRWTEPVSFYTILLLSGVL